MRSVNCSIAAILLFYISTLITVLEIFDNAKNRNVIIIIISQPRVRYVIANNLDDINLFIYAFGRTFTFFIYKLIYYRETMIM